MSLLGMIGSYLVGLAVDQLQAHEAVLAPELEGLAVTGAQDLVAAIAKADAHLPVVARTEINAIVSEYEPQLQPLLAGIVATGLPAVIEALQKLQAHLASL